jgi:DNA replication and repair protein RecF
VIAEPEILNPVPFRCISIKQKNSLLREVPSLYNKRTYDLLEIWDQQIAELGSKIIKARGRYVEQIRAKSAVRNRFTRDNLAIRYLAANEISSTADLANILDQLSKRLTENRNKEIRLGRCLTGPHRDELSIDLDRYPVQQFASAGQQRSALLSYSLAQMEVYFDEFGEYPVFLVDDFDSELDASRMNDLLEILWNKTQVFLTTTKPDLLRPPLSGEETPTFFVRAGQIT